MLPRITANVILIRSTLAPLQVDNRLESRATATKPPALRQPSLTVITSTAVPVVTGVFAPVVGVIVQCRGLPRRCTEPIPNICWIDTPPAKPFERPSANRARFRENVWVLGTKKVPHKRVDRGSARSFIVEARHFSAAELTRGNHTHRTNRLNITAFPLKPAQNHRSLLSGPLFQLTLRPMF
jgi:hypothetical protein